MTGIIRFIQGAAKFIAAATGAVAVAVSLGLLSGDAQKYVTGGLAVATAFTVYFLKNAAPVPASTMLTGPAPAVAIVPPPLVGVGGYASDDRVVNLDQIPQPSPGPAPGAPTIIPKVGP
jgi:hypothetical protein